MEPKKIILLILLSAWMSVQAANLHVHLQDGGEEIITLSEVASLTYDAPGSALQIHLMGGGLESFTLNEIRKLTFSDLEAVTDEELALLETFTLLRNYPNPFNNTTTIEYQLPTPGMVQASIYNIRGQHVCTLTDGYQEAGLQRLSWDGRSANGRSVSSGLYVCQVSQGQQQLSKRLLLLK